ncbi:hypothetical protein NKG94_49365 [Micromonospora sp. M12]
MHLGALGRQLLTLVLDAEPTPVTPGGGGRPPPAELAELTGRWWWMGTTIEVYADADGDLRAGPIGAPTLRFVAEGPDRWRGRAGVQDGEILTVRRDEQGRAVALDIATFVYTRHPDEIG